MRKYILLLMLFLIPIMTGSTSVVHAESYGQLRMMSPPMGAPLVVTSPYNPERTHPMTGVKRPHRGVDLSGGSGAGAPVYAVADGVVTQAGYESSFDGWVIIDHGGWETWYGDLDPDGGWSPSWVGKSVKAGEQIGHCAYGATSVSSGPHLHFEVRINGTAIRPAVYQPYAPWMPADADAGMAEMQSKSIVWNPEFDFAGPLKKAVDTIIEACVNGMESVKGVIFWVLTILMIMDISLGAIFRVVDRDNYGNTGDLTIKFMLLKVLLYALLLVVLSNWGTFIANGSREMFIIFGANAADVSDLDTAKKAVYDPFSLITRGAKIVEPLFVIMNEMNSGFSPFDFLSKIVTAVPALLAFIVIFGSFALFSYKIALSFIEFYIMMLFSFINFMWAGFKETRSHAERGINGIFSSSIKLFFFCFFSLCLQSFMSNLVVGDLISDQMVATQVSATSAGGFNSVEQIAAAIRQVESSGRYDVYNSEGSGAYGAYQQMPEFWDGRCTAYANDHNIPVEEYRKKSWVNSPSNCPGTSFGWNPEVQDEVSKYMMTQYLQERPGDYRYVATRWLGAMSDEYWGKVCSATGSTFMRRHTLQLMLVIKLCVLCVVFVFMADKLEKAIMNTVGRGNGFKFTNGG